MDEDKKGMSLAEMIGVAFIGGFVGYFGQKAAEKTEQFADYLISLGKKEGEAKAEEQKAA